MFSRDSSCVQLIGEVYFKYLENKIKQMF